MTSLGYDNQSRTLACNSTGGPATTVTWSRNGIVITLNPIHQQTKRIVDSFASTYTRQCSPLTHQCVRVTLRGRTVAQYVKNARGRSSVTRIIAGNGKLIPYMHYPLALLASYYCQLFIDI